LLATFGDPVHSLPLLRDLEISIGGLHNVMGTEEDRFQGRTRDHTWLGLSSRSPFEVPRSQVTKRRTKQKTMPFMAFPGRESCVAALPN